MVYTINIKGLERDLPLCSINGELYIAAFVLFGDVELTEHCARELNKLALAHDVMITAESKGIPLICEMCRLSGSNRYVLARKSVKLYMKDVVACETKSITTGALQTLYKELDKTFFNRVDNMVGMGDHDIGFDFTLSTVATYKATGEDIYREKSIAAAKVLGDRFREKGQFIQIAGDADCKDAKLYRLIIDCLMNINLLYWAGKETGDAEFTRKGFAHFNTTIETVVRDDGSTLQNFYFDQATGARLCGGTKQGLSATSCWSRGQAWGVTGVPFTYYYMKNDDIIPKYYKIVDYYLDRLPTDKIAYWDLDFTDGG